MNGLTAAEIEVEALTHAILAAENWSKQYSKDPDTHGKLIKTEARIETALRRYFKELSDRAPSFINWYAYTSKLSQVAAAAGDDFNVDVMISDDSLGKEDGLFIQAAFDPIAQAVALGAASGEKIYSVDVGTSETTHVIQRTAKQQVAELVGKRVDGAGNIVPNPDASMRISETTRKTIRESISTSLSMGEDQATATARLIKSVKNPSRAALIARTEAVNGYQRGLLSMGKESGAVGKEWQASNNDDICGGNADAGIIKINESFPSGHQAPAGHPNCRCSLVLIYPEDPRAELIGKGAPSKTPSPDFSIKDDQLNLTMKSGSKVTYKLTQTEQTFIKESNLEVRAGAIKGATQGYYTPAIHSLTIGNPDPEVFYHELGHAIDHKLINNSAVLSKTQAADALAANKKAILMNRIRGSLGSARNFSDEELTKYISGMRAKFVTKEGIEQYATMDKRYQRYIYSQSELFAEAYRQYRLMPSAFKKEAPDMHKILKELGL
jgi:hypothetical protein